MGASVCWGMREERVAAGSLEEPSGAWRGFSFLLARCGRWGGGEAATGGIAQPAPQRSSWSLQGLSAEEAEKHVVPGRTAALRAASGRCMGLFSFWTSEAALSGPGLSVLF